MSLKYATVCSGIEAPSMAWDGPPLNWTAQWFSEIEPFPSAVLAHHYPNVPNLGDMTQIHETEIFQQSAIDVLCGGTPCQGFSLAGLRGGLNDPRSQLSLTFIKLAARKRPRWVLWENVPGVLSSEGGRDFATFLAGLTGRVIEPPKDGWRNSGIVEGIPDAYGAAWRVLDAQYFGVAQRRRRVFVVGYIGDWRRAAAVLLDSYSLQRHTAPSREKGQEVTQVAGTLTANGGGLNRPAGNANELDFCVVDVCPTLRAGGNKTGGDRPPGTDVDTVESLVVYGIDEEQSAHLNYFDTLKARTLGGGFEGTVAVFDPNQITSKTNRSQPTSELCHTLPASSVAPTLFGMAVRRLTPIEVERLQGFPENFTRIPNWNGWRNMDLGETPEQCIAAGMEVRHNKKTGKWRVKDVDGPRYKALGNSMAVPCMKWIGKRIQMVDKLLNP